MSVLSLNINKGLTSRDGAWPVLAPATSSGSSVELSKARLPDQRKAAAAAMPPMKLTAVSSGYVERHCRERFDLTQPFTHPPPRERDKMDGSG